MGFEDAKLDTIFPEQPDSPSVAKSFHTDLVIIANLITYLVGMVHAASGFQKTKENLFVSAQQVLQAA